MVTIDTNGALHDGLGLFSHKPQNVAGYDIAPPAAAPVGDDPRLAEHAANTKAVLRAVRAAGLAPRTDLSIEPSGDLDASELTITVAGTTDTTGTSVIAGVETARVVRTEPARKGFHGNDLHPGWALHRADGTPMTPEQITHFLRTLGEKVTDKPDDPRTYEGPDAAKVLISKVKRSWCEQRTDGGA